MDSDHAIALAACLHETLDPDFALLFELLPYEKVIEVMLVLGGRSVAVPRLSDLAAGVEVAAEAMRLLREEQPPPEDRKVRLAYDAIRKFRATQAKVSAREQQILRRLNL